MEKGTETFEHTRTLTHWKCGERETFSSDKRSTTVDDQFTRFCRKTGQRECVDRNLQPTGKCLDTQVTLVTRLQFLWISMEEVQVTAHDRTVVGGGKTSSSFLV